jgi:hypothetical protein
VPFTIALTQESNQLKEPLYVCQQPSFRQKVRFGGNLKSPRKRVGMGVLRLVVGLTAAQQKQIVMVAHWGRLCGFIIVQVSNEAKVLRYLGRGGRFRRFGDEGSAEDPNVYTTVGRTSKSVKKFEAILAQDAIEQAIWGMDVADGSRIALAIWVHPESHFQPLVDYCK